MRRQWLLWAGLLGAALVAAILRSATPDVNVTPSFASDLASDLGAPAVESASLIADCSISDEAILRGAVSDLLPPPTQLPVDLSSIAVGLTANTHGFSSFAARDRSLARVAEWSERLRIRPPPHA